MPGPSVPAPQFRPSVAGAVSEHNSSRSVTDRAHPDVVVPCTMHQKETRPRKGPSIRWYRRPMQRRGISPPWPVRPSKNSFISSLPTFLLYLFFQPCLIAVAWAFQSSKRFCLLCCSFAFQAVMGWMGSLASISSMSKSRRNSPLTRIWMLPMPS